MINYLKDIKKETLIGQLPDVINSNNDSIRKEFNWMFDSSLNRLTKSVYAPTGSVKAHFGEFVNLSCEYLTIKNEESIKNSIQSTVELVIADSFDPSTKQLTNHNILNHRFIDSQYEGVTDYTHDAASIVYEKEDGKYVTVKDALVNIGSFEASLDEVYEAVKQCDSSITELAGEIKDCVDTAEEFKDEFIHQNTYINEIKNDINVINSNIEIINSSVNSLESNVNIINASVNNLDASINDLYTRIKLPIVRQSGNATISPNVYNIWNSINSQVTISKGAATDTDYVNEYIIKINNYISGQIIFTGWNALKWAKGEYPSFIANHAYEISIIDNFASYIEYY